MSRRKVPHEYEDIVDLAKDIFGDDLKAVVFYGHSAKPGEAPLHSDINVAVITENEVSAHSKTLFYARMGRHVVPIFLTSKQLMELADRGDYFAHAILRGSLVLFDDGIISELKGRSIKWRDMLLQVRRKAMVSLGIAAQCIWRGAYGEALNYMYKSMKSCFQWLCINNGEEPPPSDNKLSMKALSMGASKAVVNLFSELNILRRYGAGREKCHELMEGVVEGVKEILGLGGVGWRTLRSKIRGCYPLSIEVFERGGALRWRLDLAVEGGRKKSIEV